MVDVIIAVVIDWIIGDPYSFPHPIRLMGKIISLEENFIRRVSNSDKHLFLGGLLMVFTNIILAFAIPYYILMILKPYGIYYNVVNIYLIYTAISAKCLHKEAMKIYKALKISVEDARYSLSFIVGRETSFLDRQEIIRATVETVAENSSDGVIAPLIFAMIGGAPLAMTYKIINTMDSMVGYLNEKYRYIGYYPAKTDDIFNYIPARITGVLMNLSSLFRFDVVRGIRIMIRDRKNHKSPNCAYPEGAAAGLLGIELGGDNVYFGKVVSKPKIGDKIRDLEERDIPKSIEIMYRTEILLITMYIMLYYFIN